jgi:hypothetical protein
MTAETLPPQAEPDTLLVLCSRVGPVETVEVSSDWAALESPSEVVDLPPSHVVRFVRALVRSLWA